MARITQPLAKQTARWQVVLNTIIVILGTLLSRILGLVRESVFAYQFGILDEYGAFVATFTVLDTLYIVVVGGALGSALIPVFSRLLQQDDDERAWEMANTVLTFAFMSFIVAALLMGIFAEPLLGSTVGRGYGPEQLDLAVSFLRIMLIQPLLLGVGGLMVSLSQSFDRFALPVIALNVYNLSIIGAALFVSPLFASGADKMRAVCWGVVAGALLYFLVQLPGVLRVGLRFKPSFNWRMPEVQRVGKLLAPRLFGQTAVQLNVIVMYSFLSWLQEVGAQAAGAQAAFRYSYQLMLLPHGLIAVSLATVMFPRLTRLFAGQQLEDVRDVSQRTMRLSMWLILPAVILLLVLYVPVIRLLFQSGQFGNNAFDLTASMLVLLLPGAIGLSGAEVIVRTFYAMEDTRTPVIVGVVAIIFNALLVSTLLQYSPSVTMVALSYTITTLSRFVVLLVLLIRRLPGFLNRHLVHSLGAMAGGGLAVFATVFVANQTVGQLIPGFVLGHAYNAQQHRLFVLGGLVLFGLLGVAVYLATCALLRSPEIREAWVMFRQRKKPDPDASDQAPPIRDPGTENREG